ncbi:MAG: hypothetical protein P4M01_00450 [Acidobacteriota bacterium]|nr:hypothetical protein [Acidobacteriota bacterium]
MHGYTLVDLQATLEAALLYCLFLLPPGFLLGYAANALGFRSRSAEERALISLVLSLSIVPVAAELLARASSLAVAVAIFLLAAAVAAGLIIREFLRAGLRPRRIARTTWLALGLMGVWTLLGLFALVDWQTGNRLYLTYATYDHSIRVMMVDAVVRTGVPPHNPLYGVGSAPVLRYYYFWYVLCALPVKLAHVAARGSFNASVLWCGYALAALVPLYLKYFSEERKKLRVQSVVGIALLFVTGLDVLPYTWLTHRLGAIWGDTEWWDQNQVASWIGSMVWVPNHLASLIACLTGFLLLHNLAEESQWKERFGAVLLAGACFASAFGLSIYVTFVFAVFLVIWTVVLRMQQHAAQSYSFAAAGIASLVFSLPYLGDLRTPSRLGARFAFLSFRDTPLYAKWLYLQGVRDEAVLHLVKYPGLALTYFVEFGVFFLVACLTLRAQSRRGWKLNTRQAAGWVMLGINLLLVTFVASDATNSNDLGFRGILVTQWILLVWAAPFVASLVDKEIPQLPALWKLALVVTLFLGLASTFIQVGILRAFGPVIDAGLCRRLSDDSFLGPTPIGENTLTFRQSVEKLQTLIPASAVVQYNPEGEYVHLIHLFSNRQAVAGDNLCGSSFGGDYDKCKEALQWINPLYRSQYAAREWNVDEVCDRLGINVLLATNTDAVWNDELSWARKRQPIVDTASLRAFACGTQAGVK